MKKFTLIIIITLAISNFQFLKAQITLEKEYDFTNVSPACTTKVRMFLTTDKTYYIANAGNNVFIFNEDHSDYKTVTFPNEKIEEVHFPSDKLFNSDDKIEFIILTTIVGDNMSYWKLVNEDGDIIQTLWTSDCYFGRHYMEDYITYYQTLNKEVKIILNGSETCNKILVYAVPGHLTDIQKETLGIKSSSIFPNPAKNYIHLNIPKSTLVTNYRIFDFSGGTVDSGFVNPNTEELKINISSLPTGTYILEHENNRYKFIIM